MNKRVGLALSGGGSRAAAFHLGCLRALHDHDVLERVNVVTGVSGGALLSAVWAYGPRRFDEFEANVTELLHRGLQWALVRRILNPVAIGRSLVSDTGVLLSGARRLTRLRSGTRTEALASLLDATLFQGAQLDAPTNPSLSVVLTATDLRTGAAVRFGSQRSGCSRYGRIREPVSVGTAVAASAAYPLLLPALERRFTFDKRGEIISEPVLLADGGIYDNLGLSVLAPDRSPEHTEHIYDVDYIISCDAGRGQLAPRAPRFLVGRTARAFEIIHTQAQNHGRARLHEWATAGAIDGFAMAYLGMQDSHLARVPAVVADLVPRSSVIAYPTNFAAMRHEEFERLTVRGEQLVRALLPSYCPRLLA